MKTIVRNLGSIFTDKQAEIIKQDMPEALSRISEKDIFNCRRGIEALTYDTSALTDEDISIIVCSYDMYEEYEEDDFKYFKTILDQLC